jgi:hypothetical protein
METTVDEKPAYKFGESGKPYTYTAGDEASRKKAKRKAYLQGVAIGGGKLEKLEKVDLPMMEEQSSKKYTKDEAIAWLTEHNFIADIQVDSPWCWSFYQVPVENMYNMKEPNYTDYDDGISIRYTIVNDNINVLCIDFDKKQEKIIKLEPETLIKNEEDHTLFGWAYVAKDLSNNQIIDHSEEFVKEENFADLEVATYFFNIAYRQADIRHDCVAKGYLIDSMVFTKEKVEAMRKSGHLKGDISLGVWMGYWFPEDEDWNAIKEMKSPMFSLYGNAIKEFVEEV